MRAGMRRHDSLTGPTIMPQRSRRTMQDLGPIAEASHRLYVRGRVIITS